MSKITNDSLPDFGNPDKSEEIKKEETIMARMGLTSIEDLEPEDRKKFLKAVHGNERQELAKFANTLDEHGMEDQADLIDYALRRIGSEALHECGLSLQAVDHHQTLFDGYKEAKSLCEEAHREAVSSEENPSSNFGSIRAVADQYMHNCNAVRLHELYFEDVIDSKPSDISCMDEMINELFYSDSEQLLVEIKRMAMVSRNGWCLLNYCHASNELYVTVIDLHDIHVSVTGVPVMALDMWEHAYILDFGLDKESYIDWFLNRMCWDNVLKRIEKIGLQDKRSEQ